MGNVLYEKFSSYKIYGKDKDGKELATWNCSDMCKINNNPDLPRTILHILLNIGECIPIEARRYIQQMDKCTKESIHDHSLQGHSKDCYVDPQVSGSKLLFLRLLAPHYSNIRKVGTMFEESITNFLHLIVHCTEGMYLYYKP